MNQPDSYLQAFQGSFTNMLRWEQFDALIDTLRGMKDEQWYVYAIGEPPPAQPASAAQFEHFLDEIGVLLRRDHQEDYCGIVYADDREAPNMVKIYDPNNLGSVCGSSGGPPPLPGWVISRLKPVDLPHALPQTGSRRRWWQRIFHLGGD